MALICSKLNRSNTQHCPTDDKTRLASGFYASMFEHTVKLPKKIIAWLQEVISICYYITNKPNRTKQP